MPDLPILPQDLGRKTFPLVIHHLVDDKLNVRALKSPLARPWVDRGRFVPP